MTKPGSQSGVTKSSAWPQTGHLARKGLADKEQYTHSNKDPGITLTEQGWKAYESQVKYHGININAIARRLERYTMTQITTASDILDAMGKWLSSG